MSDPFRKTDITDATDGTRPSMTRARERVLESIAGYEHHPTSIDGVVERSRTYLNLALADLADACSLAIDRWASRRNDS